jgi:glycosyltransferase involved in cell wall biosynthesis
VIRVLVIAGEPPTRPHGLAESLRTLRAAGVAVSLVGGGEFAVPDGLADLSVLPAATATAGPPGAVLWRRFARDSAARRHAARADVLVALDPPAVHTVWQLARKHRTADAVFGLAPAIRAVEARRHHPARHAARRLLVPVSRVESAARTLGGGTIRHGRAAARAATGTRVHRLRLGRLVWRTALHAVPLPARVRLPLTRRVTESLTRAGYPEQAADTLAATLRRLPRAGRRAAFLAGVADRAFARGELPPCLADAVIAELTVADAAHARRDFAATARSVRRAARLLFHRGAHLDRLDSPAAPDPTAFLAGWHASTVGRALATPRGRAHPPAAPPTDRPHRILFTHCDNDNFLDTIQDRYAARPDVETRRLDVLSDPELRYAATHPTELVEHLLAGRTGYGDRLDRAFRPYLDWADTVWVDWCTEAAGLLAAVDPGTTRVVLRLHSVEAFTDWPHLIDPSRVDDLVFVSAHLRDYTLAAAPHLAATRTTVLTNAMRLNGYRRRKPDAARFTVGLVGFSSVAKDPRWALRVLRLLRAADERYRLVLIGGDLDGRRSAAGRGYQRALAAELHEWEPSGAVRRRGATDDVAGALAEVGVILSSSVRESFHCGLVEGAASGAVPVVRDWPYFDRGAAALFPADWVVTTPDEAVARIRAVTGTEEHWRRTGSAAAEHALATWNWPVVAGAYDRLLFGRELDQRRDSPG